MARVPLVRPDTATPELKAAYDELSKTHHVSNMKAVALRSPEALRAILEWYALHKKVVPFLGERLAILFCDAISRRNRCELCATFMHREIVKWGEDPFDLKLDARDEAVIAFGRQLATDANAIPDELFAKLRTFLDAAQLVDLTTYGALMIVNNLFNSALQIELDDDLDDYKIDPEKYFA